MTLLKYGVFDIFVFDNVYIDTITACNRRCYYCPNSKFDRGLMKNVKKMDTALFYKIIDELAVLKWKGEISPNFYGEPLLDGRLTDLIKYARNKLPDSVIVLFTNGDFLTVDLYNELVRAGVNTFYITQHPNGAPPFIKDILEYRKEHGDNNVKLQYRKLDMIYNREGVVSVVKKANDKNCAESCLRKIGIHWDGKVIFCCNDYFVTVNLGNIKSERLIDIWKKPYYKQIRKDIRKGIFNLEICKKCMLGMLQ